MRDPAASGSVKSPAAGATEVRGSEAGPDFQWSRIRKWQIRPEGVIAVIAIATAWQLLSLMFPHFLVPGLQYLIPTLVHLLTLTDTYVHFVSTVWRVLVGCGVASLLGAALGLFMGVNRPVERLLMPILRFFMGVPVLSWVLLVVIWFREPELRIFAILLVVCLPVVAMNVLEGVKNLPKDLYEMLLVFRPSSWQAMRMVIIPWTMPFFVVGLKVTLSLAIRLVVFAELVGATVGVGAAMFTAFNSFDVATLVVWSALLVLAMVLFDVLIGIAERTIFKWRPSVAQRRAKEL